jgi:hypothetical protein
MFQSPTRQDEDLCKHVHDHASYNVAKKILGFVYQVAIPRSHLRAAYGEGFKGAPLHCDGHKQEDTFTQDVGVNYDETCSQENKNTEGACHV